MIIHREFQQQSLRWLEYRAGKPTASEVGNLVTPKFEIRKGAMVDSYLALKVAERWLGGPLMDIGSSWATDQGQIIEEQVIPFLELEWNTEIERVGFITDDYERWGCSPDGIIGEIGVEVKSPQPVNAVKYLLKNQVPDEYVIQVQASLFVTGFKTWRFVSYHRRFPALMLNVEPIPEAQEAIEEAITLFCERLDRAYEHLVKLNGGPPHRSAIPTSKPEYESDMQDVPS